MKLLIIVAVLISNRAMAMDYDLNWVSKNSTESILVITIDGCDTEFKVKNKDLDVFAANHAVLNDVLSKAKEHKASGCRK